MKVVHINYDARLVGGASIATIQMHRAMLAQGVDSTMVCLDSPSVEHSILLKRPFLCRLLQLFVKCGMKVLFGGYHSTGLVPSGVTSAINALKPDAIVLHWLQCDALSFRELMRLEAPVFFFHHDLWPIRGITPHAWFKVSWWLKWLDRFAAWNKRRIVQTMGERLIPVCASVWAANEIRKSGMYAVEPVIVPLLIDPVFHPGLRTPSDRFRILNGARGGFSGGLKGGDRLLAALERLSEVEKTEIELVVFGELRPDEIRAGVCVRYLGRLMGEELAQQYRDADLFALPSRQETFGQTKLEALACGTPVVAFDETACAEGIVHGTTGYVAAVDDIDAFTEGIRWAFRAWKDGKPIRVPADATTDHRADVVVRAWKVAFEDAGVRGVC